jgi:hypothetical protein
MFRIEGFLKNFLIEDGILDNKVLLWERCTGQIRI